MTCKAGFVLHILIFLDVCHKLYFSADNYTGVGGKCVGVGASHKYCVLNGRIPSENGRKVR